MKAWIVDVGPWYPEDKQEPAKDPQLEVVYSFCKDYPTNSIILCERFVTAQRQNKYSRYTVALIGAVEGISYATGVPLILVINKRRLQFIPRAEEILGKRHKKSHDDDDCSSLAHLLTWLSRNGYPL